MQTDVATYKASIHKNGQCMSVVPVLDTNTAPIRLDTYSKSINFFVKKEDTAGTQLKLKGYNSNIVEPFLEFF